jgi:Short C-terminal domain
VVKVHLHISGPGFLPFDSEDRVIASVTRLGNLNARKVVVLVNPTTQEYRIDWERSALVNGLMPAQFTIAEDNRSYDLSGQAGPLMEILQILKANGVPLNRMVDIRSNPGLRAQIQAVVRRAAEQQAPAAQPAAAASAPGAAPGQPPIVERLAELETLRGKGVLTDEEYHQRRAQIISEI